MSRSWAYCVLVLAPLIAWTAYAALGFSTVSLHCRRGYLTGTLLGMSGTRAALAGLAFSTALLIIGIAVAAVRRRRAVSFAEHHVAEGGGLLMAVSALACCLVLLYLLWALVLTSAGSLCA